MADFQIWGRYEQLREDLYYVIVTAVPESSSDQVLMRTDNAPSIGAALATRDRFMRELEAELAARGDRVTQRVTDATH